MSHEFHEPHGIRRVAGNAYVVNGKAMCIDDGLFDVSNPLSAGSLMAFADSLYDGRSGCAAAYGRRSVCVLRRSPLHAGRMLVSVRDLDDMAEPMRSALGKELFA